MFAYVGLPQNLKDLKEEDSKNLKDLKAQDSSGVRLCWELEEPEGPEKGRPGEVFAYVRRNQKLPDPPPPPARAARYFSSTTLLSISTVCLSVLRFDARPCVFGPFKMLLPGPESSCGFVSHVAGLTPCGFQNSRKHSHQGGPM